MKVKPAHVLGGAAFIAACANFISPWEGLRTHAYRDLGGVWTVCYGETAGVDSSTHLTAAECGVLLQNSLPKYVAAVDSAGALSDGERVAYTDFAYNVGIGAWRRSSMWRYIKLGQREKACNALMAWDKVRGRVIPWQRKRRTKEKESCLNGLNTKQN
jgi:lysozyme